MIKSVELFEMIEFVSMVVIAVIAILPVTCVVFLIGLNTMKKIHKLIRKHKVLPNDVNSAVHLMKNMNSIVPMSRLSKPKQMLNKETNCWRENNLHQK